MSRTRWTWVVVGGVAALLFVAGVDALRSSADSEASAPAASTTTTEIPSGYLPSCTQRHLRVSIEVREGVTTVVARNIAAHACYRFLRVSRLTIEDRAGNLVWDLRDGGPRLVDGFFRSGSEKTFRLPKDTVLCDSPGPYLALVTVGPYSARRGNLSRSEIACGGAVGTRMSLLRARYVAQAELICTAATARFREAEPIPGAELTELEFDAAWSKAAARFSEKALAKLRALAPPKADRVRINRVLSSMELLTDVLRQLAAAASDGDAARARILAEGRIRLTHRKDGIAHRLALFWGVFPAAFSGCPVSLPA
jgi:hypothetical protein